MRRRPILWILIVISGLILAACASPASSPDGSDAGPGDQSEAPEASQAGGDGSGNGDGGGDGNGGLGGGSGSVQYEIRGSGFDDSGELPFAGNFAYFQQAGVTFLVFTEDTEASEANGLIVILSDDGNVLEYLTDDLVIPTADCEWDIDHNDASGAAGSFTCNDAAGFGTDGTVHSDLDINGSFDVDL